MPNRSAVNRQPTTLSTADITPSGSEILQPAPPIPVW
jgi:hypothetical protein